MLAWLLVMAQDTAPLIAEAKRRLSAERNCPVEASTDITVCGLRRADRYRVPIVAYDAGDPAHEGVSAERERLLHRTNPVQNLSPFLVGGGMVGVSATVDLGSGSASPHLRAPAP